MPDKDKNSSFTTKQSTPLLYDEEQRQIVEDIYVAHREKILNYIYAVTRNFQDAEDRYHEVFVRFLEQEIDQDLVQDEQRLRSHLFTLAFWVVKDWYRGETRRRQLADNSASLVSRNYDYSPLDILESGEGVEAIKSYLSMLPEEERDAIELRCTPPYPTLEQIGRRLGVCPSTVSSYIDRGIIKLRRYLRNA